MATTKNTEVVTKETVSALVEQSVLRRENDRKKLLDKFKHEAVVSVSVSPFYKPYFGSTAMVSIQGIAIYIPVNGRTYKVPKSFAADLNASIAAIDSRVQKIQRMSNVAQNFESSAGQLRF